MRNITRRYCSFIVGGLVALAMIAYGVYTLVSGADAVTAYGCIGGSIFAFTLVSCLFLGNNIVGEVVGTVLSWGFVRMPGVIFTLDLDGLIWLLSVKLLFWVLGILIAIAFGILAIILGAFLSIFIYPFAIANNFRSNPEEIEI